MCVADRNYQTRGQSLRHFSCRFSPWAATLPLYLPKPIYWRHQNDQAVEKQAAGKKERNQGTHHTLQLPAFARNKQWHLFALLLDRSDLNPLEPSRKAHAWYRLEGYNFSKWFLPIFRTTMKVYKQWIKTPKSHSEIVKIWVKHSHKVLIIL